MKNKSSIYMVIGVLIGIIFAIINKNIAYMGMGAVAGLILQTLISLFKNKDL